MHLVNGAYFSNIVFDMFAYFKPSILLHILSEEISRVHSTVFHMFEHEPLQITRLDGKANIRTMKNNS